MFHLESNKSLYIFKYIFHLESNKSLHIFKYIFHLEIYKSLHIFLLVSHVGNKFDLIIVRHDNTAMMPLGISSSIHERSWSYN